ncbi:hypothetical protein BV378_14325 [Nostoc sp. RF31YmG]|nr:hypothetical protein BV378_14325 [Nostoc sp. RF31YmG]
MNLWAPNQGCQEWPQDAKAKARLRGPLHYWCRKQESPSLRDQHSRVGMGNFRSLIEAEPSPQM